MNSIAMAADAPKTRGRLSESRSRTTPVFPAQAAVAHHHRNLAAPIAPVAGRPFDDAELASFLEQEGRKLLKAKKLPKLEFERRTCAMQLPAVSSERAELAEVAARAEGVSEFQAG